MEDTLRDSLKLKSTQLSMQSLNPCCNGRYSQSLSDKSVVMRPTLGLNPCCNGRYSQRTNVLSLPRKGSVSLNPCCNGRYSQRTITQQKPQNVRCLNPCCNGRYSQSVHTIKCIIRCYVVLILVVMEDTLRVHIEVRQKSKSKVLS